MALIVNGDLYISPGGRLDQKDKFNLSHTFPGGTGTYTFTLPTGKTAKNLMITWNLRADTAATEVDFLMRFNGDTGANYAWRRNFWSDSNTQDASQTDGATSFTIAPISAASTQSNYFASGKLYIPDYTGTTFYKGYYGHMWVLKDTAGAAGAIFETGDLGGSWVDTSALSSVTFLLASDNFVQGSIISVRGW